MIVDAAGRAHADSTLASAALGRNEVVDTPIATQVYEIVDAVWLGDDRMSEIISPAG